MSAVKTAKNTLLTEPIRVAVVGSGGREHALARKIASSPFCKSVVVLPGNAGMLRDHSIHTRRKISIAQPSTSKGDDGFQDIDLVVIGPDDLLAAGMTDELQAKGHLVFGPTKAAAKLEWSKSFAKKILEATGIPSAHHVLLTEKDQERMSEIAVELGGYPLVLKYDGLALGKGVLICETEGEALAFLADVFSGKKFSARDDSPHPSVVAERFLQGHEISLFALTDGDSYVLLDPACDHKRLLDGNRGPNTGGMGAYSPVPWLPPERVRQIGEKIFPPVLAKMREIKTPFRGLLYAGLMVRGSEYWVLEFNARFGDPETQVVLPRLESDLLPLLYGVACGDLLKNLEAHPLRWTSATCVNVVAASEGYPEKPKVGFPITGRVSDDAQVFYSGVRAVADASPGESGLVTSGGRVFSVSCLGETVEDARAKAIAALQELRFEGMHYRKDIGRVRLE
jgi:phosphoribosylamine--glycine ligase